MSEKDFKKWLEKVDAQVSVQNIDLNMLGISENKEKISEILARIPRNTGKKVENFKEKPKIQGKTAEKLAKSGKNLKKSQDLSANPELKFVPAINKKSQEIVKKLEPASNRIFAPKSRNSFENLQLLEQSWTSMQSKSQSIKFVNIEESTQRMYDWNKARLERLRKNQEERQKKDLEICTFKPSIKGKLYIQEEFKAGKTIKKGYSGKILNETKSEPSQSWQQDPDLENIEYEHAVKRLHWELESLYLRQTSLN